MDFVVKLDVGQGCSVLEPFMHDPKVSVFWSVTSQLFFDGLLSVAHKFAGPQVPSLLESKLIALHVTALCALRHACDAPVHEDAEAILIHNFASASFAHSLQW